MGVEAADQYSISLSVACASTLKVEGCLSCLLTYQDKATLEEQPGYPRPRPTRTDDGVTLWEDMKAALLGGLDYPWEKCPDLEKFKARAKA